MDNNSFTIIKSGIKTHDVFSYIVGCNALAALEFMKTKKPVELPWREYHEF